MFLISKCRGDRDLGLCTTLVLVFGEPQRSGDFREKKFVSTQEKSDFAIAQHEDPKMCTDIELGRVKNGENAFLLRVASVAKCNCDL